MTRQSLSIPSYRLHKPSGQAVVTLSGKDHYLGLYDNPKSRNRYDRLIAEWLASDRELRPAPVTEAGDYTATIGELIVAFWRHAEAYYRKNGEPTGEIQALRYALLPLNQLYGEEPVTSFGPIRLKAVRQAMISRDLARTLINKRVNRIRHLFKWGVENELVPPEVHNSLKAVSALKRGRSAAREADPVKPAPQHLIDGIEPYVSPQVWAMVQLQLRTAMRPGEVVAMRRGDIDMSGQVWVYQPGAHKTEHHGYERLIYLGPEAQDIVQPFLDRDHDRHLFSPNEAEELRLAQRRDARQTPLYGSKRRRRRRNARALRKPREHYDVGTYRRAIARGCDNAFPWANDPRTRRRPLAEEEKSEKLAWQQAHRWHPHQLRHNAATFLRREFGVEAARLILGHRSIAVTELYAELDQNKAMQIIAKVG